MDSDSNKKNYQAKAKGIQKYIQELLEIYRNKKIKLYQFGPNNVEFTKINIEISLILLEILFLRLQIDKINFLIFQKRINQNILNDIRKDLYVIIAQLEKIVGQDIDTFSYKDQINNIKISNLNSIYSNEDKYYLCCKIGYVINITSHYFGESSKWKWSFVDLEEKLTTLLKNIIDLPTLIKGLNPNNQNYQKNLEIFQFLKQQIEQASQIKLNKYSMILNSWEDLKKAMQFILLRQKIARLENDQNKVEECKKKHALWSKKYEEDFLKFEQSYH